MLQVLSMGQDAAPGVSTAAPRRRRERQMVTLGVLDPVGSLQARTSHLGVAAPVIGDSDRSLAA
jgi:hypothetical protein